MKPENLSPDLSLLKEIPITFSKANLLLPVKISDGELVGLVSDENGMLSLIELARKKGLKPSPLMVSREELLDAIGRFYGQLGSAEEVMETISGEDLSSVATEFEKPRDLLELTEDAPIIRLLNAILQQAVKERASDIHIEPYEKDLEIRFRVDGVLTKVLSPPKLIQDALITRVKVMAALDIAEKRLPQDGRIRLLIGGRDIDIRVSIIPTVYGERVVLRLLDRAQGIKGLNEVGLEDENKELMEGLLSRTNGIILVTGPTGSGKTTTLYACLNRLYSVTKNIITIEDPVEYQLKGIGQIQVNPKIGLTFATGLRSILRQDPDIIMVGEIRDLETAEIAIQASLTGHLVLSTLHTNDAPSAITRLLDMGIEPYLLASSLSGVIAQRLVRTVCPYCRISYEPSYYEMAFFVAPAEIKSLIKGSGCERCKGTGYLGRTGLFEILIVDNEIRELINKKTDSQTIKEHAVKKGMKTLRMDGLRKVLNGITTIEEVLRVTQREIDNF
ncbi:MAG: type II secretion system ATPase GspE [Thermodesulfovibrionales bacterium]|nr:type II secretion system ATPase GspE [Thermodesulfovibrionales bacterium]